MAIHNTIIAFSCVGLIFGLIFGITVFPDSISSATIGGAIGGAIGGLLTHWICQGIANTQDID